eukprot:gnl/TRDRNA2_/TRDRNA2_75568_c0_seq1.p1 gnl/TRDRNA2_/TRDRNA2_75568_c0~~gnl/TRDRNA2_/TRDRNA2_75568_c0_seq1.p1  ORF type:complete len:164 (-),score=8.06 gnl/TRDRNA2_/TRDRNA2_75568_c0_seq1:65-556(-)
MITNTRCRESDQCHQKLFSQYKFFAAFENNYCDGYITEKFARGLREGMVPLAAGGIGRHDYEYLMPGYKPSLNFFIHMDDYASTVQLAQDIMAMSDAQYDQLHAWRSHYRVASSNEISRRAICNVCQQLHEEEHTHRRFFREESRVSFEDWWYEESCREPRYI